MTCLEHWRLVAIVMICGFWGSAEAQQTNCDDAFAQNNGRDETCLYKTKRLKTNKKVKISPVLTETSGLARAQDDGLVWTHNDSGDEPFLYLTQATNGAVVRRVRVGGNATNNDWEDLAESENHLFIGDFGNNKGTRRDLTIYIVSKKALHETADNGTVTPQTIRFYYPEQQSFTASDFHNFDCEAFFYADQRLHLFTKNRGNGRTYHYTLPAAEGTHAAQLTDSLNVRGLITGADISADKTAVALVGYTAKGRLFAWLCYGYGADGHFLSGNSRYFKIGHAAFKGQMEAVVWSKTGYRGWVSSEKFLFLKARMYRFSAEKWLSNIPK